MNKDILTKTVSRLLLPPKGILAIDESLNTCNKRFEKLGIPPTVEKRREYRELLITAPEIEKYISGYILFDETIRQNTKEDKSFISVLQSKGVEIGIKVDKGVEKFSLDSSEKITKGLDGLSGRLEKYKNMGATFAKWRAIYNIGENIPSLECMKANANIFAQYAHICQRQDIVPIIEPEILIDGDYTVEKCYEITAKNLDIIFSELQNADIFIPGIILKTNMIISGKEATVQASAEKVAEMTIKCLKEHVPNDIGGIVFLSGGQSDEKATLNLKAMHQIADLPWLLTFSYGRAIQNKALQSWAQNSKDTAIMQKFLLESAKINSLASIGKYQSR